jgi:hypothetical protein
MKYTKQQERMITIRDCQIQIQQTLRCRIGLAICHMPQTAHLQLQDFSAKYGSCAPILSDLVERFRKKRT